MNRQPPRPTLTDPLFPYTPLFLSQPKCGGREELWYASTAARDLAEAALAAVPAATVYARVDMIGDGHGGLAIMELELIEPQLFLNFAPDKGVAFGQAVYAALSRLACPHHSHCRLAEVRLGGSAASLPSPLLRAQR